MLQALFERGIAPDLIVGTSVGAINGAFIASREPTVQTTLELGEIWRGLRRSKVFPANPLIGFIGFIGASDHLVPEGNLRRLIAAHAIEMAHEGIPLPIIQRQLWHAHLGITSIYCKGSIPARSSTRSTTDPRP